MGSAPLRPGRRPSRGAPAPRFRGEPLPGGSWNDPERRVGRVLASFDVGSGRPFGSPSPRFQASSIGPDYRRRPASQRSRPRPSRAMVNPPHSRVQRKVAMAEPCSAPTLREPAERTGAVPEEAEQGLAMASNRWGAPLARRDLGRDGLGIACVRSRAGAVQAAPDSNTSRQLASQRPPWKRSQQVRQASPRRRRRYGEV
jgi:hypothetical protein